MCVFWGEEVFHPRERVLFNEQPMKTHLIARAVRGFFFYVSVSIFHHFPFTVPKAALFPPVFPQTDSKFVTVPKISMAFLFYDYYYYSYAPSTLLGRRRSRWAIKRTEERFFVYSFFSFVFYTFCGSVFFHSIFHGTFWSRKEKRAKCINRYLTDGVLK